MVYPAYVVGAQQLERPRFYLIAGILTVLAAILVQLYMYGDFKFAKTQNILISSGAIGLVLVAIIFAYSKLTNK